MTEVNVEQNTVTAEQARALIEQEERRIDELCLTELNEVLKRHKRALDAKPYLTQDGMVRARIELVRGQVSPIS